MNAAIAMNAALAVFFKSSFRKKHRIIFGTYFNIKNSSLLKCLKLNSYNVLFCNHAWVVKLHWQTLIWHVRPKSDLHWWSLWQYVLLSFFASKWDFLSKKIGWHALAQFVTAIHRLRHCASYEHVLNSSSFSVHFWKAISK
jgi:hypothetical protein